MTGILGLLAGLALLIWMALRGINVVFAAVICSIVVILSNGMPFAQSLSDNFTFGDLGAFTFAGRFFLLFAAGAIFGRVMGESHAATSIALVLVEKLGAQRALWIIVIACGLLTYGGVVVFVVIFAIYPLGLRLLKEANIPKRLLCGAVALGAGTFTLTALPGTPSIHNVIPTTVLGTDLFAGAWLGLIGGAIMFALGMLYLERERKKAAANGEIFEPAPTDVIPDLGAIAKDRPNAALAMVPLLLVIGTILTPRMAGVFGIGESSSIIAFANAQPILWPSIALVLASIVAAALFPAIRRRPLAAISEGVQDSIMPLMATSTVIGFGGVVAKTGGFQTFTDAVANTGLPPLLSMAGAISVVSGVTGSSSGGLQIFMATMADKYIAMGIDPEELHRLVVMAAGGFDSLPHCGAVIAMLTITGLTHKQAYKDVGMVTVAVPVVATLICIALAMIF
ncbi:MAG: GntP family permease [Marinomonas sp.]